MVWPGVDPGRGRLVLGPSVLDADAVLTMHNMTVNPLFYNDLDVYSQRLSCSI
jgi:hypothetical protein